MKTPEQLKGAIRNIAKENNLMPQEVLILAEKYETIIRRNIGTTRARDFYDLYMLFHNRKSEIRKDVLSLAVKHTAGKRGSIEVLKEYEEICVDIKNEEALHKLWLNYSQENAYSAHLKFADVVDNVLEVGKYLEDA